ncbi:acyl-CoA dehydrogenase family protein [Streptomyces sp. MZ04]|uniref:acyl-CoA dehydrogenase family protein n=1 Tax=Streptomyces sp. MZ04 TaxID=2559236 RepID=UPI00107ECA71|nr:acyl-CoA dehydrogenase family protein [Streptomyces sp. MZ04]TGA92971.1 acyl-CoA dehydrogenase [Streptomyces sp. MZ04]
MRTLPDLAALRDEAADWDLRGALPERTVRDVAAAGLLGLDVPERYGGGGATPLELGELCARLGSVCGALRGLVTVQGMVAAALARWGGAEQRARWLPRLAAGDQLAGFAATEQEAGSDLTAVETRISEDGDALTVTGDKRWITFGELATVCLVLGRLDGRLATVLVETDRPGVTREPVSGQLGMRAARIAHIRFDAVRVPKDHLVAPAGFGLSHVAGTALDHGRFTVGWGCLGMAEACLADATAHTAARTQAKVALADHQLVRSALARAAVDTEAARELCRVAARLRREGDPEAISRTVMAKYAAARAAASVSGRAVQLMGSAGCAPDSRAGRFFRDAQVMRIIEGSDEVSELHIAEHLLRRAAASGAEAGEVREGGPRA